MRRNSLKRLLSKKDRRPKGLKTKRRARSYTYKRKRYNKTDYMENNDSCDQPHDKI